MKATYEDIMTKLHRKEYAQVYFLSGEEPLYIDKISRFIEDNIVEEADRDFNQAVFYAKDTTVEDVIASAKEFPFGSEKKVVIVKEAQNWNKFEALKNYISSASDTTVLVICYKYGKLKPSEIKFFEKNTVYFESAKVPNYQLAAWVEKCAKEYSFKISPNCAALIAEHIGNDLSRIDNEFRKFQIFIPANSEITPEIIENNIGISKQYNIFELQDALSNHDAQTAYKIIMAFCQNVKNNPIIVTINSLYNYYHGMLAYQLAPNKNIDEMKKIFGYSKSEKQLARLARIAMNQSKSSLIKYISTLREFDVRCKGVDNSASEEELYKELIYKIMH